MDALTIKRILIPTDFSKTGLLAVEHAAFMARIYKAELYLMHAIELSESAFSIYNPAIIIRDITEIERIANDQLTRLAEKLKKEYAIKVNTTCITGKLVTEVATFIKKKKIDILVMGTHGASGFNEFFVGSNTHKIVTLSTCPVISVQTHAKKLGFTKILLPVDDAFKSRQKVDATISLAKKYAAKIYILGLLDKEGDVDPKKFKIKLEAIEKNIEKAGLAYETKITKGDNLAEAALKHSKKVKADLIIVLNDHESRINGRFLGVFAKQIVNHSRVPVLSLLPH